MLPVTCRRANTEIKVHGMRVIRRVDGGVCGCDLPEAGLNLAASGRRALERFERQQRYNR